MNEQVEIKTNFGGWRKVPMDAARRYVGFLMSGAVGIPKENRPEYIEAHRLRGITVEELMKGA